MNEHDAFESIIQNGNFEEIEQKSREITVVSIKSIHEAMASLSQATAILSQFVIDYFECSARGEDPPVLSEDAALYLTAMMTASESFNDELTFYTDEDDE